MACRGTNLLGGRESYGKVRESVFMQCWPVCIVALGQIKLSADLLHLRALARSYGTQSFFRHGYGACTMYLQG